jgi:hypothetical protein
VPTDIIARDKEWAIAIHMLILVQSHTTLNGLMSRSEQS